MLEKIDERTILGPILIRKDQDWSFLRFYPTFFNIFMLNFCEAMLKISSKTIEKCRRNRRKDQSWFYLDWSFLA